MDSDNPATSGRPERPGGGRRVRGPRRQPALGHQGEARGGPAAWQTRDQAPRGLRAVGRPGTCCAAD